MGPPRDVALPHKVFKIQTAHIFLKIETKDFPHLKRVRLALALLVGELQLNNRRAKTVVRSDVKRLNRFLIFEDKQLEMK